jgi:hypothetical protein
MTPRLPLGHEPVERLKVERLEAEWRFRVIDQRSSFFTVSFLGANNLDASDT